MALINNPIGELLHPISRLESAVGELSGEISAVQTLPLIHEELGETRETMLMMLDEIRGVRADMGALTTLLEGFIERTADRAG
jgi:hypothetical protein